MIKLKKGAEPAILARHAADWTRVVREKQARGEQLTKSEKNRYSHPDIKAALVAETHGKCAYCESKIRHVAHGDIEHVVPKSIVPEKWFEWTNLTFACEVCNGKKSDFHGDHGEFVDPYMVNPEELFVPTGAILQPVPGSEAARTTERLLELNRIELVERRTERLRYLMDLLHIIQITQGAALKEVLKRDFLEELDSSKEYAALAREIAERFSASVGLPPYLVPPSA